ncbi:VOC family protein [Pseudalkalibacillus berkeleyi]|uniref:VOC family protein n=1 Tax=Pseudalkalibacillus berkeleyi TaxID=1069813 RepID=A0ABS9H383_9BACL|nr:VOC family protein [Pseudalkalibacillus berkeleyi]MCF6138420.1 VOC family protein [Pseudalkalibacillus berkeleyi]
MNVHHFGIETNQLEQSIQFYKKLGFNVESEMELLGERLVFLKLQSFRVELALVEESLKLTSNKHIAFEIKNLDEFLREHHDLEISEGPYTFENGWKTVFIAGPNREIIELIQL